jgi:hypothetical protein
MYAGFGGIFKIKNMKIMPIEMSNLLNLLQNSVSFAQAIAVFRPTDYKTAFFSGCCCKTEVLQQPLLKNQIFSIYCHISFFLN